MYIIIHIPASRLFLLYKKSNAIIADKENHHSSQPDMKLSSLLGPVSWDACWSVLVNYHFWSDRRDRRAESLTYSTVPPLLAQLSALRSPQLKISNSMFQKAYCPPGATATVLIVSLERACLHAQTHSKIVVVVIPSECNVVDLSRELLIIHTGL